MSALRTPAAFFQYLRVNNMLGPVLSQPEVDGLNQIVTASATAAWPMSWTAYALATAYHETNHGMQPVKEMGGSAYFLRMYDIKGNRPDVARDLGNLTPGDGAKYCGRGYPQVTGYTNYRKADIAFGLSGALIANPDLMLGSALAAKTMIMFMEAGSFTGKSCASYLTTKTNNAPIDRSHFGSARRIINGIDRADLIAGYAMDFQQALVAGGWTL